jgi:hypothetical protein
MSTEREPFKPLGAQARWRTIYEILLKTPTGKVITWERLGEALALDPVKDRAAIVGAVRRAAKEHEVKDKRAVDTVRGEGYMPVDATGSLVVARKQQVKSGKALVRGHSAAVNVDLNGAAPEVRKALEVLAAGLDAQLEFNRRVAGKQVRMEHDLRAIRDSQQEDRERTDAESAELKARLERLEEMLAKSTDGQRG